MLCFHPRQEEEHLLPYLTERERLLLVSQCMEVFHIQYGIMVVLFFLLFRSLSLLYLQQDCFFCEKYHFETTSKTEVVIILDLLPTVTVSAVIVFTF